MSSRRNWSWLLILAAVAAVGCKKESPGDQGGAGSGAGAPGSLAATGGVSQDIDGPQDPASLLERYAAECPPGGITLSGTINAMAVQETHDAVYDPFALGNSSHEFGLHGSSRPGPMLPDPMAGIEYFRTYPALGSVLLPLDSSLPLGVVCAGPGSTFERTPVEELFQLNEASFAGCPGEPVDGEIAACVVFGLADELCQPPGLQGTLQGQPVMSGASSSIRGGQNSMRVTFGAYTLVFEYDEALGTVTRGLLTSAVFDNPGTYCVGAGSTYMREEIDFDEVTRLQLRGLSKLASCEGAKGTDSLRACYRR